MASDRYACAGFQRRDHLSLSLRSIQHLPASNGTSVDGAVVIAGILRPLQAGARLKIGDIELSVGCG